MHQIEKDPLIRVPRPQTVEQPDLRLGAIVTLLFTIGFWTAIFFAFKNC